MTYMGLKSIMLSGIKSQYQKIIYCMTPYIQSAHNDKVMEIENILVIVRVGRRVGRHDYKAMQRKSSAVME